MKMENPIRILFVEDVPADAEIVERELQKSGIQFTSARVDTKDAFLKALEEFRPDIIISDYAMPEFDGMQALKLAKKYASIIPFIMLTGSINEETAVECMKAGATDYVLKDRMKRLPFAVKEALEQKKIRLEKEEARQALRKSEKRHRILFMSSRDAIMTLEPPSWMFTAGNPASIELFGAKDEVDFVSYAPWRLSPERQPDGRSSGEKAKEMIETALREGSHFFEWTHKRINGEDFPATVLLTKVILADKTFLQSTVRDITEQKQMGEKLQHLAYYDALTGLPNRNLFLERINQEIARAKDSSGSFAVVLTDINKFKSIYDIYGAEVGEWIVREAMRQVKEWQNNGYPVVPVSVNMSLVQFRQKNLAEMVKKVMGECGFYPSLLILEITESAFMQDVEFTRSVLTEMKEIGCSVSIDDFGTGYSSLAHLKRFPIDNLKIDISFIREMVKDPDSASIVMAIINMAHTLNLKTIAEGIETEEQWNFLRLLRCDMGQGFYLSKPLPAEEMEKLFRQ